MSEGSPLTDEDRLPWLEKLAEEVGGWHSKFGAVLACSALKKSYRKILVSFIDPQYVQWVFLDGNFDVIADRLKNRKEHFFKQELLISQFEALEKPDKGKGMIISIDKSISEINDEIISTLNSNNQIKIKLNKGESQIGLIGLGVMGKSLAKNFLSKGYRLSVYNRQLIGKEEDVAKCFVQEQPDNLPVLGFDELKGFTDSLESPRIIKIMVSAGKPVDVVIDALLPMLSKGDCIIDGGNCHYKLTLERYERLKKLGIHFLGTGISGGEEGALKGPSIMPGGSKKGYDISKMYLQTIAAKDKNGNACCTYIGSGGAGHYVKMVHNGIEYAEMQLLAETYSFLRFCIQKEPNQIADIFETWKRNGLQSYLLEITIDILRKQEGDSYLVDKILDKAAQKGTGGWSTKAALDIGMPLSTISEAVMARCISGMKSERVKASGIYKLEGEIADINVDVYIEKLKNAFQAASIINHHIGFDLLKEASKEYNWDLDLSEIARIWTNGCIIRSDFMEQVWKLFTGYNDIPILLFPDVVNTMKPIVDSLLEIVSLGLKGRHAMPVFSAAINYFITYTSAQSSANIIQAQRDYFGAHTYQRIDSIPEECFHTNWKE